jgi:acetyltransferase-like isoleucine patch superfamily enzyme
MLETLLNVFESYNKTCSVTNISSGCVTFIGDPAYVECLSGVFEDAWVLVPNNCGLVSSTNCLKYYATDWPEYYFTLFHNYINKNNESLSHSIGDGCKIHKTAVLDAEGLKVVNAPNGSKVQFLHTGNVIIEDAVEVGPYSVVHRGTMDNTIIRQGCKFGAYTNIGHNCDIGENNVMAAGVILSGGVKTGKNCWFASGSLVRHHLNICDNVVIGLGAVVVKDITKPGIYIGNPARFLKSTTEGWNF